MLTVCFRASDDSICPDEKTYAGLTFVRSGVIFNSVKIIEFHLSSLGRGASYPSHSHPDFHEIHYFPDGKGRFIQNGRGIAYAPGGAFLSAPGDLHSLEALPGEPLTFYFIKFRLSRQEQDLADGLRRAFGRRENLSLGTGNRYAFEDIRNKLSAKNPDFVRSAELRFLSWLYEISARRKPEIQENPRMEKILSSIHASLRKGIDLETLALLSGLDKAYFVRLFHSRLGISPMRYLLKLRLETAAQSLKETRQPVYRIAEDLCFCNEFHFSRMFKQFYGVSPRMFRKRESGG
jgi:AraC-like DNA-binding protein